LFSTLLLIGIYAQGLHKKTLYEIGHRPHSNEISGISVGNGPSAIGVNDFTNTIYVTNSLGDTVSVINRENNSKIGNNIPVGKYPSAIGVNDFTNTIYVTNREDDTVSVINGSTNKKIGNNIPVGKYPSAIGVNDFTNTTYIANSLGDTVSVINGSTNKKIGNNIPVGKRIAAIHFDSYTYTIYVANFLDDTISVIDAESNKVVAKVMFNVEPFNSGHIECDEDKTIAPLSKQIYVYDGAKCVAKPDQGFEFVNWQESLNGNSTQMLQAAPAPSILDSILDFIHMKPDKSEATLAITKFGSFTANFKALPPPVPAEYWTTLFGFVLSTILGTVLIPIFLTWRKSKSQGKKLDYYYHKINNLNTNSLQDNGKISKDNLTNINNSRDDVEQQYTRGKINKEQFDKLADDLSKKYREIFKNEIESLDNLSEYDKENNITEIKKNIEDAYTSKKINELHYNLLKEKLSNYGKQ
jgi:YVTN family beta-propeller protein